MSPKRSCSPPYPVTETTATFSNPTRFGCSGCDSPPMTPSATQRTYLATHPIPLRRGSPPLHPAFRHEWRFCPAQSAMHGLMRATNLLRAIGLDAPDQPEPLPPNGAVGSLDDSQRVRADRLEWVRRGWCMTPRPPSPQVCRHRQIWFEWHLDHSPPVSHPPCSTRFRHSA